MDYTAALQHVQLIMKFLYVYIHQILKMFIIVIGLEQMEIKNMFSNMLQDQILVSHNNIIPMGSYGEITQAFSFYLMGKMY